MSEPALSSDAFEQLVRWAFDQPLYKRPELGTKPAFLSNEQSTNVALATAFLQRRAIDALKNYRPFAVSATEEFFDALSGGLEKFRVDPNSQPFDESVVKSIESFLPYRDETIAIFQTVATNLDKSGIQRLIHKFFEQLIPYLDAPDGTSSYKDWDWDNFKFIVHELFLYAVATLIRHERFEEAAYLLGTRYYSPRNNAFGGDAMVPYSSIRRYMASLKYRDQRLQSNRLSLRADLLKQRCSGSTADFNRLMQADFILFLRAELQAGDVTERWWPETLVFARSGIFEVFARARSKAYFDRLKIVLGADKKEQLSDLLNQFLQDTNRVPRWSYESFGPSHLMGLDKLATEP